ncbi:MAG: hypothetical protein QNL90_03225 [Gammaproteobacteria bacterium]|nr:hypothetical protein [Gammaproteobacteria bacterium]MDX2459105.1 hypothetical protein [Gammaproteobacteria bacterium]
MQDEISAIVAAYLGEAIWQETARKLARKKDAVRAFRRRNRCSRSTKTLHRSNLLKKALRDAELPEQCLPARRQGDA